MYYSFIYPYLIYCNHIWGSACKTHVEPLLFHKRGTYELSLVFILGHPRSLCLVNWSFWIVKIFLNIVLVTLCIVYHGELSTLQSLFVKNGDIHMHDTQQRGHYHIPVCRTYFGKGCLRYFGACLWNKILNANINPHMSDFIFSRNLKTAIYNNLLYKKFYKVVCCVLLTSCVVTVAPPAPLYPCCHKWYLSISHKEPINPKGYPAPFAPITLDIFTELFMYMLI